MVNLSDYPVLVDDVRLDTLAYAVLEHRPQTAARVSGDLALPGVDGVVPSTWDDAEPSLYGLTILVRDRDVDGKVPAGQETSAVLERNLQEIVHLFAGSPHRLKTVKRKVTEGGAYQQAQVKVVDAIAPEPGDTSGIVRVSMVIPGSYWEDVATADWSRVAPALGTAYDVTTLAGASAPIHDGIVLVTGPVANPVVTDPYTGALVRLNGTVPDGQAWRVNCATWASRLGAGLTLSSADTSGTDVRGLTTYSGGTARYLTMIPERTAVNTRRVRLSLSGSGNTATTAMAVRARRKYLL